MIQQKIEEAARNYAEANNAGSNPRYGGLEEGFEAGANHILQEAASGFEDYLNRNAQAMAMSGCWFSKSMLKPEETWQAASLHHMKRIMELEETLSSVLPILQMVLSEKTPDAKTFQSALRSANERLSKFKEGSA